MTYVKDAYVAGNMCDSELKLSVLAADGIVENAITELMGDLGIDGIVAMEKYGAMWLMVKNNICFIRRPSWREEFVVRCYLSGYTAVKLYVDTIIESHGGDPLIKSRMELAAVDLASGRIRKADTVGFTGDMAQDREMDALPFTHFPKEEGTPVETITVRSTSLDYCYHTNNIEYVRFVLNTYDAEFLKTHEPTGLEIHYLGQSFEGERLDIEKLCREDGDLFRVRRDGNEITACKIAWRKSEDEGAAAKGLFADKRKGRC